MGREAQEQMDILDTERKLQPGGGGAGCAESNFLGSGFREPSIGGLQSLSFTNEPAKNEKREDTPTRRTDRDVPQPHPENDSKYTILSPRRSPRR